MPLASCATDPSDERGLRSTGEAGTHSRASPRPVDDTNLDTSPSQIVNATVRVVSVWATDVPAPACGAVRGSVLRHPKLFHFRLEVPNLALELPDLTLPCPASYKDLLLQRFGH